MRRSRIQCDVEGARCRFAVGLINFFGVITEPINHRLFYRITRQVGNLVDTENICVVRLHDDAVYAFHLADPYWNRLVYRRFRYEHEIYEVLQLVRETPYTFLDLGANFGFWSVLASSAGLGSHRAIAVEPVARNFAMLSRNCALNDGRFEIRRAAIASSACGEVAIRTDPSSLSNVGASIFTSERDGTPSCTERVPALSIDDLCADEDGDDVPLVIKLDVEGMEIEALKGAKSALNREMLLIYEDHGKDPACRVTEYVLNLGLRVFHREFRALHEVRHIDEVRKIKKQPTKGYNLFACQAGTKFSTFMSDACDGRY